MEAILMEAIAATITKVILIAAAVMEVTKTTWWLGWKWMICCVFKSNTYCD